MRIAALVRILTGLLFVASGISKVTGEFVRGGFAADAKEIAAKSFPFWRQVLGTVVIPRAGLFSWIIALGEVALGIGLLLGLLTRVAAAGGALLMLSIVLGEAKPDPGAAWGDWITCGLTPKLALLLMALLFAADSAKVWSLDARLRHRPRRRAARSVTG